MTYTADMNHKQILESGNWFTSFVANTKTRTVSFNYCDRRRAGQVARRYIVRFEKDCSTVKDIIAISANGGRVEMFKSTVARETAASILRRGMMVEFEQKLEEECEPEAKEEQAVEPAKVSLSEKFEQINVKSEKQEAIMHGVLMLIVTLLFIVFASTALYLIAGGEATKETMDVLLTSGFSGIFLCILSMMKP